MSHPNRAILVSACLLGVTCRYDGRSKPCQAVEQFLRQHNLIAVPICPEQLGGLSTPRLPCEFTHGDGAAVLNGSGKLQRQDGAIMNDAFISGARQALLLAQITRCNRAILKERSPSCGVNAIIRNANTEPGCGVTTALLRAHGIAVTSDEQLPEIIIA